MAGMFTRKKLAFIQLASSKGLIYAPSTAIGLVHNIVLFNNNTTTETVVINLNDGTHEYVILTKQMATLDTFVWDFHGEGLIVDAASSLTGNTTTVAKVTCLVCGSEET
jgi:hypothetical protein